MDELEAEDPQRRTDTYLCLPETEALGVKLRDGGVALELKLRDQISREEFPEGVAGSLELWRKWSFPVKDARSIDRLSLPVEAWVTVEKARRLAHHPDCQVELTELRVAGQEWWTLGFEASGARPVEALAAALGDFFDDSALVETVLGARSFGYPAWLGMLS
jgi:hypothetical protein